MPVETWASPLTGGMPIHFGDGALDKLPEIVRDLAPDRVFVVSDPHVFDLYGALLVQVLGASAAPEVILIPEGENEKKLSNLEALCVELFNRGATRSSVVVTFGGGVVLNVGGLAAGLVYRGVRFVHVPTTMMAQSDVIVSNKQGLNFGGGKNRLGLFATPAAALCDPRFFATETPRQVRAALVEYAKNAILLGGAHYDNALSIFGEKDAQGPAALRRILRSSLEQKFEIARLDPTERAYGLVLEYGHTVGHAVEFLSQGRVLHGEAVYHGMMVAGRLANLLGILPDAEHARQRGLLGLLRGVPAIPADISVGQIIQSARRDNKKRDQSLSFILMDAVGRPHKHMGPRGETVLTPVPEDALRAALTEYRDALL
ncbi:MAG TPA: iron-containing alcohol dehydrogenase [Fibrobacteria bacterium]|jgi:3-dehydroquinate synthase|nr:iron-containing alcohol dehydrogenase [Fibrobacteria bacterium]